MSPIDRAALIAYADAKREIPDSDLDNEQPITLIIRTTLGEIRRLRRVHRNLTEARFRPSHNRAGR